MPRGREACRARSRSAHSVPQHQRDRGRRGARSASESQQRRPAAVESRHALVPAQRRAGGGRLNTDDGAKRHRHDHHAAAPAGTAPRAPTAIIQRARRCARSASSSRLPAPASARSATTTTIAISQQDDAGGRARAARFAHAAGTTCAIRVDSVWKRSPISSVGITYIETDIENTKATPAMMPGSVSGSITWRNGRSGERAERRRGLRADADRSASPPSRSAGS